MSPPPSSLLPSPLPSPAILLSTNPSSLRLPPLAAGRRGAARAVAAAAASARARDARAGAAAGVPASAAEVAGRWWSLRRRGRSPWSAPTAGRSASVPASSPTAPARPRCASRPPGPPPPRPMRRPASTSSFGRVGPGHLNVLCLVL
ncbi:hypothetical protein EE612_043139 [Oryza sativa]|nr:hypothetical protein EE612_043139 [Oryza sativa]